jgi:CubicO group peptidase (beta-lactamase class C family)
LQHFPISGIMPTTTTDSQAQEQFKSEQNNYAIHSRKKIVNCLRQNRASYRSTNMKKIIALIFAFRIVCVFSQPLPPEVEASAKQRVEFGLTPSIAIGIIDKTGARYYEFGTKTPHGALVDRHTIYEIGSITKTFTAILLAQQVVEGKMKLNDPIKNYLPPEVKVPQYEGHEITLGSLSDHTSGFARMPSNISPANPANPYADYTVQQMYDFISVYTLPRDVGEQYEYSNLAQGLLGHILARQAGTSYEDLMIKAIARPLGMKETKITLDDNMKKNLAAGHANGKPVENWDLNTLAGAGAIRSSTYDMLNFLAANAGLTKTSLRKAMDLTHTVRHDKAGNNRVGLGWHIASGKDGDVVWHNGGTGGYRTFAGFVKEKGVGVVVLTNSNEGADDLGFHLLNPNAMLASIKARVTTEMKKAIDSKGIEAGIARFYELKTNNPNDYDFSEASINTLGYQYMGSNLKAALAIFKLNVGEYPASFNVYDSYGEALLKDGQTESAIENYNKSVEINPGNVSGIEVLKKLGVSTNTGTDVSEAILEKYVGEYQLAPTFFLTITRNGKKLFAQATGQSKFEIFAKSETDFYYTVVDAQITFDAGNQQLTLHQNGQNVPGKKVK